MDTAQRRISKRVNRETERIEQERARILAHLSRLEQAAKEGWSLLRISDEFRAIERAAKRAKDRAYKLYMWLGREEIERQQKARRQ